MDIPTWVCPVTPFMGPIWGSCGHAHLGLPSHIPYMGRIWGSYGHAHLGLPSHIHYMGPIWGSYGHAHLGLPSHTPHRTNMGFVWACSSGLAQSHPIWDQYGGFMGVLPCCSPYGTHIVVFAGNWFKFANPDKMFMQT